eukprot:GILI01011456.1.p1 GENE.GILI01011456.1~~GILI01011456.1.p1  ORF type:complete len:442 (+),score=64.33 GILI01011456.1:53-1378(+)
MGCMSSKEGTLAVVIKDKDHWIEIRKRFIYGKSKFDEKKRDKLWDLIDLDRSGSLTYAEVERGAIRELELEKLLTRKQLTPILVRAFNGAKVKRKEKVEGMYRVASRQSIGEESSTNQNSNHGRQSPTKQTDLSSFRKGIIKNQSQVSTPPLMATNITIEPHFHPNNSLTPPGASQPVPITQISSAKFLGGVGGEMSMTSSSQQFVSQNALSNSNTNTANNTLNGTSVSIVGVSNSHEGSNPTSDATQLQHKDAFDDDGMIVKEDLASNPLTAPGTALAPNAHPIALRRKRGGGDSNQQSAVLLVTETEEPPNERSISISLSTSQQSKQKGGGSNCSSGKLNLSAAQREKLHQLQRDEFRLFLMYIADYMELYFAFQSVDSSGDNKVSLGEFASALPLLKGWGIVIEDPEVVFNEIDKSGDGSLTFKEFSEWAIEKHMQVA